MMRPTTLTLLILVLFCSCTETAKLNNRVYRAQIQAVINSPYESAAGKTMYVDIQKRFRKRKLSGLLGHKLNSGAIANDTILIKEQFSAICMKCTSDRIDVLYKDTIYSLVKAFDEGKQRSYYNIEKERFNTASDDFYYQQTIGWAVEILSKIRKGENWTAKPLQYGSDGCFDGDHTFVTVVYPGGKTESIYVRCWKNIFYR